MSDFNVMQVMLDDGKDNALLRFTMGSAFYKHQKYTEAIEQLAVAVKLKPDFISAWLLYGKSLMENEEIELAQKIIRKGIQAARKSGDTEACEELQILLQKTGCI